MPTSHELYDQADQLKDDGKLEEAAAKFEEIVALDPGFALAHSALAVVLGRLGRHEEAITHGRKVCELQPDDAFGFTALSVTYQRAYAGTGNTTYIRDAEDAMARSRMMQGH